MSDRLKNTAHISNEEVIKELTKDLKSSLSVEEHPEENNINPGTSSEELPSPTEKVSNKTDIPADEQEFNVDTEKDLSDTDSIDELTLKDEELELTEDQKSERQIIAEELKLSGNLAFKNGDYELSVEKYTEALKICPLKYDKQRSILYCNRSAAKMKLEKYNRAIKDCTKAIELDDKYIKAYIRRAQCYEHTEKYDECLADYKRILELDPQHRDAQKAVVRLPPLIEQKNEKLKTEMMGKLKDLGNMILKPFGLSTENFQLEQDPDSKGYKINFKQ